MRWTSCPGLPMSKPGLVTQIGPLARLSELGGSVAAARRGLTGTPFPARRSVSVGLSGTTSTLAGIANAMAAALSQSVRRPARPRRFPSTRLTGSRFCATRQTLHSESLVRLAASRDAGCGITNAGRSPPKNGPSTGQS